MFIRLGLLSMMLVCQEVARPPGRSLLHSIYTSVGTYLFPNPFPGLKHPLSKFGLCEKEDCVHCFLKGLDDLILIGGIQAGWDSEELAAAEEVVRSRAGALCIRVGRFLILGERPGEPLRSVPTFCTRAGTL